MKHLVRSAAAATVLTLAAFGLTACGTSDDDDCDDPSPAVAQFAAAPELPGGRGGRGISGSMPKPPKRSSTKVKPKGGKPPVSNFKGPHHNDICDED
ncbi:hypothetical protein WKI65_43155 [Streptomyces sp. MS1.AVA.3]|uniref:hypothetical protein n=1 Tax=Streptomyces decoyicus TaxID=249567 RepID=UPI0030C30621